MDKIQTRNRTKLNVTLDSAIKEDIVQLANDDGRSISWLIETAMKDYFKKIGRPLRNSGKGTARQTGGSQAQPGAEAVGG
jgi:hypothetical protein